MRRILIFGCGSIGQRHIRVLRKIGNCNIAAYRTKKGFYKQLPADLRDIKEFFSEKEAFEWKPDYMIISNPSSMHLEYLLKGIDNKVENVFVEKPLASNFRDIKAEMRRLLNYKSNIAVGFNLRFHIVFKTIKEIIESKKYGRPLRATLEVGQYLPDWHPYEDYRNMYSARKELGGGVLRTLCHEIDLAQHFFGEFKCIYAKVDKIGDLEIDVDDNVWLLAGMANGLEVEIRLDYLRPVPERKGEILFEKGCLRYDFIKLNIEYANYKTKRWKTIFSLDRYDADLQYEDQMRAFLKGDFRLLGTLRQGLDVMKVIELAQRSSKRRKELCFS